MMASAGMTQTFDAKQDAIISLLGCVFQDLDFVPGAMRAAPQKWVSEPSPLDPPYVPPASVNSNCRGRCYTCMAYYRASGVKPDCPPEVKWVREYKQLRARYRIEDVEASLVRLSWAWNDFAQAVWSVYVEPWPDPKTEPIAPEHRKERDGLAALGVIWMASDIEGDILAFGEKPPQRARPAPTERDRVIVQMRIDGASYGEIVRAVRCSKTTVRAVLTDQRVSRGRMVSAVG